MVRVKGVAPFPCEERSFQIPTGLQRTELPVIERVRRSALAPDPAFGRLGREPGAEKQDAHRMTTAGA